MTPNLSQPISALANLFVDAYEVPFIDSPLPDCASAFYFLEYLFGTTDPLEGYSSSPMQKIIKHLFQYQPVSQLHALIPIYL